MPSLRPDANDFETERRAEKVRQLRNLFVTHGLTANDALSMVLRSPENESHWERIATAIGIRPHGLKSRLELVRSLRAFEAEATLNPNPDK